VPTTCRHRFHRAGNVESRQMSNVEPYFVRARAWFTSLIGTFRRAVKKS
jgi:hypothetical protein